MVLLRLQNPQTEQERFSVRRELVLQEEDQIRTAAHGNEPLLEQFHAVVTLHLRPPHA